MALLAGCRPVAVGNEDGRLRLDDVTARDTERALGFEYDKYMCPITDGDLDMTKIVEFLRKAGYDRDLCIEDESLGKYDVATRREHVKAAITLLRRVAA